MLRFQQINSLDTIVGYMKSKYLVQIDQHKNDPSTALSKFLMSGVPVSRVLDMPPSNSSTKTINELNYIINRMAEATIEEREFAQRMDDLDDHYDMWSDETESLTGKYYGRDWFYGLTNKTDGFLNHLKMHFNRARPFQIAPEYGKKIVIRIKDPSTPAYPSGHSFDAWMFATVLSERHPEHTDEFGEIADRIGDSRVVAGVHYLSDLEAGKRAAIYAVRNKLVKAIL